MQQQHGRLKRTFGLWALFIYGLGDILGAGIYALIGKVVSEAGHFSWMSFSVALAIALLTALSYAELVRRHPHSGGASYFIQVATKNTKAAFLVGWLLMCVSLVSMATLARAFHGYAEGLGLNWSPAILIPVFIGVLTAINLRGSKQSSVANIISTTVEVSGLIIVVVAAGYFLTKGNELAAATEAATASSSSGFSIGAIIQGAALAFYAFIGFEDLANIADEAKEPKKHMPLAILGSLIVAGLFYVLIGWLSTAVVDPKTLAQSSRPLTEVVAKSGLKFPLEAFGVIALFAVANTCLLNFITGSRVLYGMAMQRIVPSVFEKVHGRFQTPYVAILCLAPVAILLALTGDLKFLAETTSILILFVFCSTNYSLIKLKKAEPESRGFRIPVIIPWIALITNIALILFTGGQSLGTAVGFLVLGFLIYWSLQKKYFSQTVSEKRYGRPQFH